MVASTMAGGVRSALRFAVGMLAGLGLTGVLHGGAQLVSPEPGWLRESIALAAGGNLLVGLVLLPLVLLVAALGSAAGAKNFGEDKILLQICSTLRRSDQDSNIHWVPVIIRQSIPRNS